MNNYYPKDFTDSLGLHNLPIGFYYVLTPNEEGLIECWTPTQTSSTHYEGDLPLEHICTSLNNKTKDLYKSLQSQEGDSKIDVIKRVVAENYLGIRDANELVKEYTDLPTYTLIKGGPLDNKCVVKGSILPINLLDIYPLALEETLTFDNEDEWYIGTFTSEAPNNFFLTSIVKYSKTASNKVLCAYNTSGDTITGVTYKANEVTDSNKELKEVTYSINDLDERYRPLYKGTLKTCIELEPVLERVYKEGQRSMAKLIAKSIKAYI